MRKTLPAALSLPVLLLATACSSGAADDNAQEKQPTAATKTQSQEEKATEEAKKIGAMPPAQLEEATLSGKTAGFEMKPISDAQVQAGAAMKADKAECQPLASLAGGTTSIKPVSVVHRSLEPADAKNATIGSMWLASHSEKNARQVMADLRTSLEKCPKGFKTLGLTYESVKRLDNPGLGDEAVNYRITNVVSDNSVPLTFTVVRKGGVIVSFYGLNMLDTKNSTIPEAVVKAQLAKL